MGRTTTTVPDGAAPPCSAVVVRSNTCKVRTVPLETHNCRSRDLLTVLIREGNAKTTVIQVTEPLYGDAMILTAPEQPVVDFCRDFEALIDAVAAYQR